MPNRPPLLLLIDGHALVFVAYYALKESMTISSTGEPIGAVYGFLNSFIKTISDFQPTHCVVAFDPPGPTFRHELYVDYKAHRPPTPPDLPSQIAKVKQLMNSFGIPVVEAQGFEADDVLGTLSKQSEARDLDTVILTVDTDALQLVSPRTRVYVSTVFNKKIYDIEAVKVRYEGLGPDHVADIKGLEGDSSDNIPGVAGVGRKTAIKLLTKFGTVEEIYKHIDEVTPAGLQKRMRDNEQVARDSKHLTTIVRNVPVKLDLDAADFSSYDRPAVVEFLKGLEFGSIIDRLPHPGNKIEAAELPSTLKSSNISAVDYRIVDTGAKLSKMVAELNTSEVFAFDTETTSEHAMQAQLVGLSFSNAQGKGWYVPIGHITPVEIELGREPEKIIQMPMSEVLDTLRPLLENESIGKIAHNAKYDITVLANHGVEVRNLTFDTMLAAHLIGRRSVGLKTLARDLLGEEMTPIKDLIGSGKKQITMALVPIKQVAPYASADADFTYRLYDIFSEELERMGLMDSIEVVEIPLVHVLVRMQRTGLALNVGPLREMSTELGERLAKVERSMYALVGYEFKIGSSQQLANVLYGTLKLPPMRKTKSGYSTDAASLDYLNEMLDTGALENVDPRAYDIINHVMEFRELSKLKSTYVDALPELVNPKTGRIHTNYNQTGSATGRVSSNDPNVQNIPVRTDLGRRVRRAFVTGDPDWILVGADYSQIELRILAHMSEDSGLLEAFHEGLDIHNATSSLVYGVPIEDVTIEMRRVAKVLNFGVLYGLTAFGIIQQTDLSAEQGRQFIETYFANYPGIKQYVDNTIEACKKTGFVSSLGGRRRYLPEINSSNRTARQAAERAAINMPVQGTAADIIKIAMLRVQDQLDATEMKAKMILQVHDELVFEVPQSESQELSTLLKREMSDAMELKVPLLVEMKAGPNWDQMEPL